MDFDNLQSVSSVSDTLPYEAISITGRDCFWDGSVPNPLVSVLLLCKYLAIYQ
jgi:hypothetical protein